MKRRVVQKGGLLFLLGCILLGVASFSYLFIASREVSFHQGSGSAAPDTLGIQQAEIGYTPVTKCKPQRFQTGIAFPQWEPTGYGSSDTKWQTELPDMKAQTNACWIEMPVLFMQDSSTSIVVKTGPSTPTIASFIYGIRAAHTSGYRAFITPLLDVNGPQTWSGMIRFSTYQQEQQWFESYWQALKPYVIAAAQTGVEEFSLGTEYEWLQNHALTSLWNRLIANVRSIFSGALTYDMNWTGLQTPVPTWMHNADLKTIGISAYLSLIDTPARVDPKQISGMWRSSVKPVLDTFAIALGKPIILSEVGYRNSADALYHSWESTSSAPRDPQEQAAACDAVLTNITSDSHIVGSFFWGWDDVGAFSLKDQPAVTVLHNRYASLHA